MFNSLRDYVRFCESVKLEDSALFRELLAEGLRLLSMTDLEGATMFGVSRPTVTRWKNGETRPHLPLRSIVRRKLKAKAVRMYEEECGVKADRTGFPDTGPLAMAAKSK